MNTHPFIPDLSEETLEDLQTKITELNGKRAFLYRMGKFDILRQLEMVLANYQEEYQKRQQAIWDKSFKKNEDKIKVDSSKKL